jgi:hypothetical protein
VLTRLQQLQLWSSPLLARHKLSVEHRLLSGVLGQVLIDKNYRSSFLSTRIITRRSRTPYCDFHFWPFIPISTFNIGRQFYLSTTFWCDILQLFFLVEPNAFLLSMCYMIYIQMSLKSDVTIAPCFSICASVSMFHL